MAAKSVEHAGNGPLLSVSGLSNLACSVEFPVSKNVLFGCPHIMVKSVGALGSFNTLG